MWSTTIWELYRLPLPSKPKWCLGFKLAKFHSSRPLWLSWSSQSSVCFIYCVPLFLSKWIALTLPPPSPFCCILRVVSLNGGKLWISCTITEDHSRQNPRYMSPFSLTIIGPGYCVPPWIVPGVYLVGIHWISPPRRQWYMRCCNLQPLYSTNSQYYRRAGFTMFCLPRVVA